LEIINNRIRGALSVLGRFWTYC